MNHFSFSNWSHNFSTLKAKLIIGKRGFKNYFKEYDQFVKQYSNTDGKFVSLVSWKHDKRYTRKKEWYKERMYMPFEDIMIPVPKDYDLILTKQFGDYMKPAKEPSMHGGFEVLDASSSYKVILPIIRKKYFFKTWVSRWKQFTLLIKNIINKRMHNKKNISQ